MNNKHFRLPNLTKSNIYMEGISDDGFGVDRYNPIKTLINVLEDEKAINRMYDMDLENTQNEGINGINGINNVFLGKNNDKNIMFYHFANLYEISYERYIGDRITDIIKTFLDNSYSNKQVVIPIDKSEFVYTFFVHELVHLRIFYDIEGYNILSDVEEKSPTIVYSDIFDKAIKVVTERILNKFSDLIGNSFNNEKRVSKIKKVLTKTFGKDIKKAEHKIRKHLKDFDFYSKEQFPLITDVEDAYLYSYTFYDVLVTILSRQLSKTKSKIKRDEIEAGFMQFLNFIMPFYNVCWEPMVVNLDYIASSHFVFLDEKFFRTNRKNEEISQSCYEVFLQSDYKTNTIYIIFDYESYYYKTNKNKTKAFLNNIGRYVRELHKVFNGQSMCNKKVGCKSDLQYVICPIIFDVYDEDIIKEIRADINDVFSKIQTKFQKEQFLDNFKYDFNYFISPIDISEVSLKNYNSQYKSVFLNALFCNHLDVDNLVADYDNLFDYTDYVDRKDLHNYTYIQTNCDNLYKFTRLRPKNKMLFTNKSNIFDNVSQSSKDYIVSSIVGGVFDTQIGEMKISNIKTQFFNTPMVVSSENGFNNTIMLELEKIKTEGNKEETYEGYTFGFIPYYGITIESEDRLNHNKDYIISKSDEKRIVDFINEIVPTQQIKVDNHNNLYFTIKKTEHCKDVFILDKIKEECEKHLMGASDLSVVGVKDDYITFKRKVKVGLRDKYSEENIDNDKNHFTFFEKKYEEELVIARSFEIDRVQRIKTLFYDSEASSIYMDDHYDKLESFEIDDNLEDSIKIAKENGASDEEIEKVLSKYDKYNNYFDTSIEERKNFRTLYITDFRYENEPLTEDKRISVVSSEDIEALNSFLNAHKLYSLYDLI